MSTERVSSEYFNTGFYAPGDSHVLRAEAVWNDLDVIQNVDNGHKLVDANGTHVFTGPNGSGYAEGEIEFKWVFFASIQPLDGDAVTSSTISTVATVAAGNITTTTLGVTNDERTSYSSTTATDIPRSGGFFKTPFTGYLAKDGKMWLIGMV